jgi:putative oligomerization/nucleic acid binding protein
MGNVLRRVGAGLAAGVGGVLKLLNAVTGNTVGGRGPGPRANDETRLRELRASGALTQAEYERAVRRLRDK